MSTREIKGKRNPETEPEACILVQTKPHMNLHERELKDWDPKVECSRSLWLKIAVL